MRTVLLTWELGAGLGHHVNLLPLARGLSERGHRVYIALRDLSRARSVFSSLPVRLLQAPIKTSKMVEPILPTASFAHILHNNGFGDPEELASLVEAWRALYEFTAPDLIVFDHSPTALLAARGWPARKAHIGTGFFCPVDRYPLEEFRRGIESKRPPQLDEDRLLGHANLCLAQADVGPMERIGQLFGDIDEHFLVTFAELDHYRSRMGATYWGAWPNVGGKFPKWPPLPGPKVYAYLKPFKMLGGLLAALNEIGCPTIVVADGIAPKIQRDYTSKSLSFENERLDLAAVGRECDLAILNGNHGTSVSFLLAGRPILQIPLHLEQSLFSQRVAELGAGLVARPDRPEQMVLRLVKMLTRKDRFTAAAQRFAEQYRSFDPHQAITRMVDRADQLCCHAH